MKKLLLIILGCFVTSVGVLLLRHANVVTGGTAGLSLDLTYLLTKPFSIIFFVVNIPFYVFSFFKMGWKFTLKTIGAITLLTLCTSADVFLPNYIIPHWIGSIIGGFILGIGLSTIFMGGASLGGANIVAVFLQQKYQWNPGLTNYVFDFFVVLLSFFIMGITSGIFSIVTITICAFIISYYKQRIADSNAVKPINAEAV